MRRSVLALSLLLAAPAAAAERVTYPSADGTVIEALLVAPEGQGPHPAVVLLHGCGGRDDARGRWMARDADWARRLASLGYLVLAPDSFGPRGLREVCTLANRPVLPSRERRADALGARAWLAARGDVRAEAIALMGFSNGGSTVLFAADAPGFAAFVAFYPGCRALLSRRAWRPAAPLLLLIGALDDWTPEPPCAELAAKHAAITYVAYPGAYHGFDGPGSQVRVREGMALTASGTGRVHVGPEPAARADAQARVPAFLAAKLPR
jgi:dienelactone hydrolase